MQQPVVVARTWKEVDDEEFRRVFQAMLVQETSTVANSRKRNRKRGTKSNGTSMEEVLTPVPKL